MNYDDSEVQAALSRLRKDIVPELEKVGRRWIKRIGVQAVSGHMEREVDAGHFRDDWPAPNGRLRMLTDKLASSLRTDSLTGANNSANSVTRRGSSVVAIKGSALRTPSGYHLLTIHEQGAMIPITDRSRRFFWAKYFETENPKWKYMGIKAENALKGRGSPYFLVPPRQTLTPAFEDVLPATRNDLQDTVARLIKKVGLSGTGNSQAPGA